MFAVFQTGGKQYRVEPGDELFVEKLKGEKGESIRFDQVLMVGGDGSLQVGDPLVKGGIVTGEVLAQGRAKKILVFKFKRRKKYRKTQGHRQSRTRLKITDIRSN